MGKFWGGGLGFIYRSRDIEGSRALVVWVHFGTKKPNRFLFGPSKWRFVPCNFRGSLFFCSVIGHEEFV